MGFLERVRRYLHEQGFLTGLYVNKKTGWSTVNIPKQYADKFGVEKKKAESRRLVGKVIENKDQLKMLIDNKWFDHTPVLIFRLVENEKDKGEGTEIQESKPHGDFI